MVPRKTCIRLELLVPVLAVGAALALLGGCKRSEEAPAPKPQAAAPQAPVVFRVTRIDLGSAIGPDKKVTTPSTTFKPGDTIYASIATEGAAANAALGVRWTFGDGQLVNEATQNIAPTGPAVTEFHIAKPDGWPAGKYTVDVSANGKPAGSAQFTVAD
jgi:hypothetical protein